MKKTDYIYQIIRSFELAPMDERWASTLLIFSIGFLSISFLLYSFLSYRKKDSFFRLRTFFFLSISFVGFFMLYSSPHVHSLLQIADLNDLKRISGA